VKPHMTVAMLIEALRKLNKPDMLVTLMEIRWGDPTETNVVDVRVETSDVGPALVVRLERD
jgi:hypothetical protein